MGKRGLLAVAFLALAVGFSAADDDPLPPIAPINTFTATLNTVGDPAQAGRFQGEATFDGFPAAWVTDIAVTIYKVTIDADGNEVLTSTGQTFTKTWANPQASGTITFSNVGGVALPAGNYRAYASISSSTNPVPVNSKIATVSNKKAIP